jgi:hypothetical protein
MPDDELAALTRRLSYSGDHPFGTRVEREWSIRLVAALIGFKRASERTGWILVGVTFR